MTWPKYLLIGVVGFILGALACYVYGQNLMSSAGKGVPDATGNYCCDRVDALATCEKAKGLCPADKPVLVSVP